MLIADHIHNTERNIHNRPHFEQTTFITDPFIAEHVHRRPRS